MNALTDQPVVVERRTTIWTFRLNRPDQRNAVDPEVSRLMNQWVSEFEADPDVRVGIIAASGDGVFCAGADLKVIAAGQLHAITDCGAV